MTVKFKWHILTGYREYQRAPEVLDLLVAAGERIADAAGGEAAGFVVDVQPISGGRGVGRVSVRTATAEAMVSEAKHRTLTKALDAGRDG